MDQIVTSNYQRKPLIQVWLFKCI